MIQERHDWLTATNGSGETALAYVVIENYLDAAHFLLESGAEIDSRDMSDETPLIHAAGLGYTEMVTLLLGRGAPVNAQNEDEETALFKAARYGYAEVCEALLAAGAGTDVENLMGQSLADVVLPRKRAQVVSVLARYGYPNPVSTQ